MCKVILFEKYVIKNWLRKKLNFKKWDQTTAQIFFFLVFFFMCKLICKNELKIENICKIIVINF